jgi:hypothetical protein
LFELVPDLFWSRLLGLELAEGLEIDLLEDELFVGRLNVEELLVLGLVVDL